MPPDPFTDRLHANPNPGPSVLHRYGCTFTCDCADLGPDEHRPMVADLDRDAAEKAELDEWRATYGRLDITDTVIDWRPVYAGAAALGIALVARWVVRHGR